MAEWKRCCPICCLTRRNEARSLFLKLLLSRGSCRSLFKDLDFQTSGVWRKVPVKMRILHFYLFAFVVLSFYAKLKKIKMLFWLGVRLVCCFTCKICGNETKYFTFGHWDDGQGGKKKKSNLDSCTKVTDPVKTVRIIILFFFFIPKAFCNAKSFHQGHICLKCCLKDFCLSATYFFVLFVL